MIIQRQIQELPTHCDDSEQEVIQLSAIICHSISIFWVCIVHCAAIVLCIASQQIFIVMYVCVWCAICDFLMADLKKQYICIKFFLGSCITTKTSVYSYDPPNKQQSLSWKPGPLQTQRMQSNSGESSTPCWKSIFVCQGIAQQYFVPTSITAGRFCNWTWNKLKLKCLRQQVSQKQLAEPGVVDSTWHCASACCIVSAACTGH